MRAWNRISGNGWGVFLLRLYPLLALLAAAILHHSLFSIIPALLTAWYLFQWLRPLSALIRFSTTYFVYFTIPVLFSGIMPGLISVLPSLPVLAAIYIELKKTAPETGFREKKKLCPSRLTSGVFSIVAAVLLLSLIPGNYSLSLAAVLVTILFLIITVDADWYCSRNPLTAEKVQQRIVAGRKESGRLTLKRTGRPGGRLLIKTSQKGVRVINPLLSLQEADIRVELVVSADLAGPRKISLECFVSDPDGLIENCFELEAADLLVVPCARYAEWLVRKYLAGGNPGELPPVSNLETVRTESGLRQGIEYYGSRFYRPGDNLKNIDWKHSSKYNELITREFTEFHGQPAILLVNLAAGSEREADILAHDILITALTLGQEGIPAAAAVYDRDKVVAVSGALTPRELLLFALQLIKQISIVPATRKYLQPVDFIRLKSNLERIRTIKTSSAAVLADLLEFELKNMSEKARANPCTKALQEALTRTESHSNVVLISMANHDSEAIAFNSFLLSKKDSALLSI